ncbi:unnamed protein product, partial [Cladocopium goreaui]
DPVVEEEVEREAEVVVTLQQTWPGFTAEGFCPKQDQHHGADAMAGLWPLDVDRLCAQLAFLSLFCFCTMRRDVMGFVSPSGVPGSCCSCPSRQLLFSRSEMLNDARLPFKQKLSLTAEKGCNSERSKLHSHLSRLSFELPLCQTEKLPTFNTREKSELYEKGALVLWGSHRLVNARAPASPVLSPRRSCDAQGIAGGFSPNSPMVEQDYAEGAEVRMGNHRFICLGALGRGSYGEVWRAKVISGEDHLKEAALKEVLCRSQSELQQAIFEVQVLLALERAAAPHGVELRVPRCISYKVAASPRGWRVRTAMTVAPGESLDFFMRRPAPPNGGSAPAVRKALVLAARLLRDIGPSLQLLGPIAWHRDVNSHNILIDGAPEHADETYLAQNASFWLIDFGLAVDSQSWVPALFASARGSSKTQIDFWLVTEYIGGDSRYWPPSSWIMHLVGPEGFERRPDLCEQYQRRLDIHGLGITALELLCSVAMSSGEAEELQLWTPIFRAWKAYREAGTAVWHWWSVVYAVFSTGGDLGPVQSQLVEERLIERLLDLLSKIRRSLRNCAEQLAETAEKPQKLLRMIADMLDEGHFWGTLGPTIPTFGLVLMKVSLRLPKQILGGPKLETAVTPPSLGGKPKRFHTSPTNQRDQRDQRDQRVVNNVRKAEVALQAGSSHTPAHVSLHCDQLRCQGRCDGVERFQSARLLSDGVTTGSARNTEKEPRPTTNLPGHDSLIQRMQSVGAQLRDRRVELAASAFEQKLGQMRREVVGKDQDIEWLPGSETQVLNGK